VHHPPEEASLVTFLEGHQVCGTARPLISKAFCCCAAVQVYEQLQHVLHTDSAVAGEAAGLAMGLVMLGSANASVIEEMVNYAHETQHEKIIRGMYGVMMSSAAQGRAERVRRC
jgi:spore maturation protein SpmB